MSNDTEQCIIGCPLDCSTQDFFGTISFSQISKQVTNSILGSNKESVQANYKYSVELSNRLSPNVELMKYLRDVTEQETSLTSYIRFQSNEITKYMQGIALFNDRIVKNDMNTLRNELHELTNNYVLYIRSNRLKSISTFGTVVSLLDDVSELFSQSPADHFDIHDAALDYYSTLYSLLSNSLVSLKLSSIYISHVMEDEVRYVQLGSGSNLQIGSFYNNSTYQKECVAIYIKAKAALNDTIEAMKYVKKRTLHWLQTGSPDCTDIGTQTTTEPVTNPTIDADQADSGLWTLLYCPDDISPAGNFSRDTWLNLKTMLSVTDSDNIAQCLLAYENLLYAVYEDTPTETPYNPYIVATNDLLTAMTDIDSDCAKLKAEVNKYITNIISLETLADRTTTLLQNMSVDISYISQLVTDMVDEWQKNVTYWQDETSFIYDAIIQDLLNLTAFLPKSSNISTAVSKMNIWFKPQVIVEPSINVTYGDANKYLTAKSISSAMESYLRLNARKVMSSVFANLATTIDSLGQTFQSQVKIASSSWINRKTELINILIKLAASLVVDDTFIQ